MKLWTIGASAAALVFAASMAVAQQPQIVRLRGAIESVDGQTLTIKGRDGTTMSMKLPDGVAGQGFGEKDGRRRETRRLRRHHRHAAAGWHAEGC